MAELIDSVPRWVVCKLVSTCFECGSECAVSMGLAPLLPDGRIDMSTQSIEADEVRCAICSLRENNNTLKANRDARRYQKLKAGTAKLKG